MPKWLTVKVDVRDAALFTHIALLFYRRLKVEEREGCVLFTLQERRYQRSAYRLRSLCRQLRIEVKKGER